MDYINEKLEYYHYMDIDILLYTKSHRMSSTHSVALILWYYYAYFLSNLTTHATLNVCGNKSKGAMPSTV